MCECRILCAFSCTLFAFHHVDIASTRPIASGHALENAPPLYIDLIYTHIHLGVWQASSTRIILQTYIVYHI